MECLCGVHVCGVRISCTLYYTLSIFRVPLRSTASECRIFCFHVVCTMYSYALCGALALPVHMSSIHVISPYFGGSSLYFPIFEKISLFGISEFPYIFYTSPYLEYQISLSNSKNSLLCLIILPILKRKSPYLSSQMYHMYGVAMSNTLQGRTLRQHGDNW